MNAETHSLLREARSAISSDRPVLEALREREPLQFAHDTKLREFLEAHIAWWQQVLDEIEQHGDAYTLPPVPEVLVKP
jgi:hypothetical protein